ncbi:hypothetical protein QR680_016438 [Steinernema hermaphroditum]|uniref:protein-serine/threonine phosphatase n=1 Tax=Steinernema hermaphroditum TaxID=289476 RepID=A0AA39HDP5_9BILA|nr:hypothetical protein QR680_016438 [Steinernema hermaphroditum]
MNANNRMCQPGCIVYEELNSMIESMLEYAKKKRDDRYVHYEPLTGTQMNAVTHRVKELFLSELTLVDIRKIHQNGVVVVGDLNGGFEDLIAIISRYGFPPNKYYIFLGNYVNIDERRTDTSRPIDSLSTIMFIFLLRLRFASHVTVLRGVNETFVNNMDSRFYKQCEQHGLSWLHARINEAFDEMPLSCTVDGYFLAHGGLTQFAQTKGWLKDVERPIDGEQVIDTLVLNDMLCAQLQLDQAEHFRPSSGGYGFDYSPDSARIMLDALVCHSMISSQQPESSGGSSTQIGEDKWYYTLHSQHTVLPQPDGHMTKTSTVLRLPKNSFEPVFPTSPRGIDRLIDDIRAIGSAHFFDRQNLETTEFPPIPDGDEERTIDYKGLPFSKMVSNQEMSSYFQAVAGEVLWRLRKLDSVFRYTSEYVPLIIDVAKRVITRASAAPWEARLFAAYSERYGNRHRYPIPDVRVFTKERKGLMKALSMSELKAEHSESSESDSSEGDHRPILDFREDDGHIICKHDVLLLKLAKDPVFFTSLMKENPVLAVRMVHYVEKLKPHFFIRP